MKQLEVQDVTVPGLGFGTWEVTGESAYESTRRALEAGYRHVDTAQMYGNEERVGRALADAPIDRDRVFLTTKIDHKNARADDVRSSHEDSLRRLDLDHVDLLLIHWPTDLAPIEETVEAMDGLREEDKTRLIGVSNYTGSQVRRAAGAGPVACNQVEYHPLLDQRDLLGVVRDEGMFLTAYSPLAHGGLVDHDTLREIGADHGKSAAQVALRWLLRQDDVVALPRSESPEHIEANLDVFDFELSDDEVARIDDLPKDRRQIDPPFAPEWGT